MQTKAIFFCFLLFVFLTTCKDEEDPLLQDIEIVENPYLEVTSPLQVLKSELNNPAAPFRIGDKMLFAESGKGVISELRNDQLVPVIEGFGQDNYAGYSISVLGMAYEPRSRTLFTTAAQDVGHLFMFDVDEFPTSVSSGKKIELILTEPHNPFDVLIASGGSILVASGGTKSAYQGPLDVITASPLQQIFEVSTGIAGMAENPDDGFIYAAVTGSGQKDGSLIRWDPLAGSIKPETIAEGFENLTEVEVINDHLLLFLHLVPLVRREPDVCWFLIRISRN